jgi:site-specific DNA recombinase
LHQVYSDGASGANESCSGLDALMKDARRGLFDVVVVWRLDRFARSIKQFVAVLEKFREMGIDFISHQELLDTSTPMGRTLFSIVAAMAQLERDIRAERTARASHARKIGNLPGKAVGRPRKILDRDRLSDSAMKVGHGAK